MASSNKRVFFTRDGRKAVEVYETPQLKVTKVEDVQFNSKGVKEFKIVRKSTPLSDKLGFRVSAHTGTVRKKSDGGLETRKRANTNWFNITANEAVKEVKIEKDFKTVKFVWDKKNKLLSKQVKTFWPNKKTETKTKIGTLKDFQVRVRRR